MAGRGTGAFTGFWARARSHSVGYVALLNGAPDLLAPNKGPSYTIWTQWAFSSPSDQPSMGCMVLP